MRKLFNTLLLIALAHLSVAQITDVRADYELAFDEMHRMLKGEIPLSFKKAVFLTENAYLENQISYEEFQKAINALTNLTKAVVAADGLDYNKKDRKQVLLAGSIYRVMKDTLVIENPVTNTSFKKYPYTYDTADFWGAKDWTKMFVTKLLVTHSGNCHSLPILYKILADELGAEAFLSITPNHTYIKQWNDKTGWYNTELTSGRFPYDFEIKNNSYIKTEAIVAGVYMDTLTAKENISYAITDLAQGYIKKFGYDNIATPIRWLDTALVYYPDFPNALILKSELLKKEYEKAATANGEKNILKPKDAGLKQKFEELEKSYYTVHQVGYRRMPKEMYLNWLYRVRKDTTRKPHRFESPQPFKDYNYKVTVMTASDGYNYEFYDQEDTTRIGTVIINRLTGKIVKFVDPEKDDFPDEVISRMYDPYVGRFWQIDPLADHHKQIDKSPYSAFWGNPIRYTDPDGRCPECYDENLLATELFNVKHSLYNLFARPFGYEATFVRNQDGNYETGFVKSSGGFWSGVFNYGVDALTIAAFGRGGPTGGIFAKTPLAASIARAASEIGGEFVRVSHNMSKRAAKFEEQITGSSGLDFNLKNVKFDGFDGKNLLEAKGPGYSSFVKDGKFVDFFEGKQGLLDQAKRQINVAGDTPVIWHIAEESTFKAIQNLFRDANIKGIDLRHTPLKE
jgi:RHS repeat-associated protein